VIKRKREKEQKRKVVEGEKRESNGGIQREEEIDRKI
jgi:hypothetical protein